MEDLNKSIPNERHLVREIKKITYENQDFLMLSKSAYGSNFMDGCLAWIPLSDLA